MVKGCVASVSLVVGLVVVGCSSSSSTPSSGGSSSCQTDGTASFVVTLSKSSGDCPNLIGDTTWQFAVDGAGNAEGPLPTGASVTASSLDQSSCHLSYAWQQPIPGGTCDAKMATAQYDLTFTSTGFTGTWTFTGCAGGGDAGSNAPACTGTYQVTATRQ